MEVGKILEFNTIALSAKEFLNAVLKEIMDSLGAECGSLFLFDSQNRELVLDSFLNSGKLDLKHLRCRLGEGISGKVVADKSPVLVKDISNDERFNKNGFGHYRTKSFISLPLFTSRGLLGLINIADNKSEEPFSEKDLRCAITMVNYACMVVETFHKKEELEREKEVVIHQKQLLEKYASVGKLAANLVHEINNPLDGIIRYTNMTLFLIEQMDRHGVAKEYLLEVKTGLARIVNITKSLVEFSRLVNTRTASDIKRYLPVNGLLEDALACSRDLVTRNIIIEKDLPEGLPLVLDMGISRVFVNLIKNALEAMSENGGMLNICALNTEFGVEIIFKDSGPGMHTDVQRNIFEPFFSTKHKSNGSGLGLAICREIMNKYEGDISFISCHGKGSEFKVKVPSKCLQK